MANPTTNFGWVMPTSSSLVTNLPADFNTFGQGVDTSMAQLKGGTTGQILSKTSATDMAFTWITNDVGDITAVTAGTGISGGGTSGAVTITNSMATEITAKGDLIVGTGSATFDNLAAGTNGQTLVADSTAATGLKWAAAAAGGGMTLLSTTTLSGASTTISSINQTYKNLYIVIYNINGSNNAQLRLGLNATESVGIAGAYGVAGGSNSLFSDDTDYITGTQILSATITNQFVYQITNYADTVNHAVSVTGGYAITGGLWTGQTFGGVHKSTTAVSSIKLTPSAGTFTAGTVKIYGVN